MFRKKRDPIAEWVKEYTGRWFLGLDRPAQDPARRAIPRCLQTGENATAIPQFSVAIVIPLISTTAVAAAGQSAGVSSMLLASFGEGAVDVLLGCLKIDFASSMEECFRVCRDPPRVAADRAALGQGKAREFALDGLSELVSKQDGVRGWSWNVRSRLRELDREIQSGTMFQRLQLAVQRLDASMRARESR